MEMCKACGKEIDKSDVTQSWVDMTRKDFWITIDHQKIHVPKKKFWVCLDCAMELLDKVDYSEKEPRKPIAKEEGISKNMADSDSDREEADEWTAIQKATKTSGGAI